MRATFLFVFCIIFGIIAEAAVAEPIVALPSVFEGMPIDNASVKTFSSEDRGGSLIAIRVRAEEGVTPHLFFEEEVWRHQVSVGKFIKNPNPDPRVQFASMFCALNGSVAGACAGVELAKVDTDVPWLIPIATVRAEYVTTTVAELVSRGADRMEPAVRETRAVGQGPVVPIHNVERTPPIVWDDRKLEQPRIIWDD